MAKEEKARAPQEAVRDDDAPPEEKAMTPEKKKQLELVYFHCTMNMAVSILNFSTRSELLKDVLLRGGLSEDKIAGEIASYLSGWTTVTAFCEVFLNPTLGKLSDTYGRKPFMVVAPYAAIALKSWVLYSPSIFSLTVERIVCDGLRTLSGSTMGQSAVSDLLPPSERGQGFSQLWSRMGLALILAPLIASRLTARQSYKVAIGFAAMQLATDQFMLEETLPPENHKKFTGFATPLSLVKLFTHGVKLKYAALTMALQNLLDPKILADPWVVFQLYTLKWSREFSQMYTAIVGLGLVFGSKLNKAGLKNFGLHGHTTLCHLTTIVANLLVGFVPSALSQWTSGLMGFYGDQRTNGIKQIVTNEAESAGIARGEVSGLQANLRALMVVFGPMIFSKAYSWGAPKGLPGAPFIAVAIIAALAEASHRKLCATLNDSVHED